MSFVMLCALWCGQVAASPAPEIVLLPPAVRVEFAAVVAGPRCERNVERHSVRERHCGRHCGESSVKFRMREKRR